MEIVSVVKPVNHDNEGFKINNTAFTDDGIVINSDKLNGLTTKDAKEQIIRIPEKENCKKKINYKLRDQVQDKDPGVVNTNHI